MKQFPPKVTILTPMHSPRLRGVQARGPDALGVLGENVRVRINRADYEDIDAISKELGMARAEFMRWCAIHVARELLKQM